MKNDVLNTLSSQLKVNPYKVPEGYFENFRGSTYRTENLIKPRGIFGRLAPYASMAAAFLLIAVSGTILLKNAGETDDMTYEDYIVHSDMMISSIYESAYSIADATETEAEEIINYLIYTGTSTEDLELEK